ncbi:unnamed protein product [Nyctereutes procyonoides]|uniref:(raccoon dog) hypothetical protein n=1 Tax=Nyctereutes procyonoides TaxID=34880 RepID=A0A811XYG0_NYCPR|nr:unnamed protein product [Nyctereutes procyonoides]
MVEDYCSSPGAPFLTAPYSFLRELHGWVVGCFCFLFLLFFVIGFSSL